MARLFLLVFLTFSYSCGVFSSEDPNKGVSFVRVASYSQKMIALGEKTTDLGADVDLNLAAGVSKSVTGLELLLALQQALPAILIRAASRPAPVAPNPRP